MLLFKTFIVISVLTTVGYSLVLACLNNFGKEIGYKPLYALLLCYGAALFLPSLYMIYIFLFLVNPLFARSKTEAFNIFLIGFVMMPSLGESVQLGSAYLFDVSAQTAMSLGALVSLALRGGAERQVVGRSHFFFITVFICLLVIAVRGSTLTAHLRGTASILIALALPYAVFVASIRKPDSPGRITVSLSIVGGMLATVAIFEALTSWPIFFVMNEHLGLHPSLLVAKFRGAHLRSAGPMTESTEMGFILVFCLLAATASRRIFKQASGYAMIIGLISVGLLAPQSKGGWMGAGLGIIALAAFRSSLARPGKFIFAIVSGTIALYAVSVYRFGEDSSQGSGAYRARLLQRGIEEFWRSPFIGDNLQTIIVRMQDLKQGEQIVDFVNSYVYIALTLGILGLGTIIIAFFVPICRAWRIRRSKVDCDRANDFAAFCFSCFVSSLAMFAFTSFILRAVILLTMISLGLIRRPARHDTRSLPRVRIDHSGDNFVAGPLEQVGYRQPGSARA